MDEIIEFWDILKNGNYDVFISTVTINELSNCQEPKRSELFLLLNEMQYTVIEVEGNAEIANIAAEIR